MKFLHIAILSAIFVGHTKASAFNETDLGRAIDDGDFERVKELCMWDRELLNEGIDYVVNTKNLDFIVNFILLADLEDYGRTLLSLYRKKSKVNFEEILRRICPTERNFANRIAQSELLGSPEIYLDLFGKIITPEVQEFALEIGINELFFGVGSRSYAAPLLIAIEDKVFMSERLKTVAIQSIFHGMTALWGDQEWIGKFQDHPAITPEVYGLALVTSGRYDAQDPRFLQLLAKADQGDLLAAQDVNAAGGHLPAFNLAIHQAFSTAKPKGTRLGMPIQIAKGVLDILDEMTDPEIPEKVADMIVSYAFYRPITWQKAGTAAQTVSDIMVTRTPHPTKLIWNTIGEYIGNDDE